MATVAGTLTALAVKRPIRGELSTRLELFGDSRVATFNLLGGASAITIITDLENRNYAMGSYYVGETPNTSGRSEEDFIVGIGSSTTENFTETNTIKSYGEKIAISDEVFMERKLETLSIEQAVTVMDNVLNVELDKKLDLILRNYNLDLVQGVRLVKAQIDDITEFNGLLSGAKIGFEDAQAGATLTKKIVEDHIIDAQANGATFDNGVIIARPAITNFIWDLFKENQVFSESRQVAGLNRQQVFINNVAFALIPEKDMSLIDAMFIDIDKVKLLGTPTNGALISRETKPRLGDVVTETIKTFLGITYNLSFNHSALTNFIII